MFNDCVVTAGVRPTGQSFDSGLIFIRFLRHRVAGTETKAYSQHFRDSLSGSHVTEQFHAISAALWLLPHAATFLTFLIAGMSVNQACAGCKIMYHYGTAFFGLVHCLDRKYTTFLRLTLSSSSNRKKMRKRY
jgi:hypothetical protein